MTAEVIDQPPVDPLSEAGSEAGPLETVLLAILERHDGLCLDNEPERLQLAVALAAAFMDTIRDGTVNISAIAGKEPERPDGEPSPN
jgi:hypothetical protein